MWVFTPAGPGDEPGEIREITVSADGRQWIRGRCVRDAEINVPSQPWVVEGGRALVWLERIAPDFTRTRLAVFDTRALVISRLTGEVDSSATLVADPTRSRVYLVTAEAVTSIGPDLVPRTAALPPPLSVLYGPVVAGWGRLYVGRLHPAGGGDVLVIDGDSLDVQRAVLFGASETLRIERPLQRRREVWSSRSTWTLPESSNEVRDADTLEVTRVLPAGTFDEATDSMLALRTTSEGQRFAQVRSATTNELLAEADLGPLDVWDWFRPGLASPLFVRLVNCPPRRPCLPARVDVYSPWSYEWRSSRPETELSTAVVVLSVPPPPIGLHAAVSGHAVTLEWAATGYPSAFELEAGVAPGQYFLHATLGPSPAVSIGGVPPGTYYVRVRARNEAGVGAPSTELAVSVP
jgi:hypothetical protein